MAQLKDAAKALSLRYREQTGDGAPLLTTDAEALAYALTRMPGTFGAVSAALGEALGGFTPHTLLDVGAGMGTASLAAAERLPLLEVTCLEREGAMRRLGRKLMGQAAPVLQQAKWLEMDLAQGDLPFQADLVVASYVLGEMAEGSRTKALQKLWNAARGMLLLVEPGTPAAFAQLCAARETLLAQGAHLAAPCPHEQPCRLGPGDWCHFSCRVPRSRLHKLLKGGDAPFEDEKFCYLALARFEAGKGRARILRHPQISKGQIRLELCCPAENKSVVVKKAEGAPYRAARKASWGDAIDLG